MSSQPRLLCLAIAGLHLTVCSAAARATIANAQAADVVAVASPVKANQFLPDKLGGLRATNELKLLAPEMLAGLVVGSEAAYREYRIIAAASRTYGSARVDIFQTQNVFASYGLYTYAAGMLTANRSEKIVGWESADAPGDVIFWKDKYVVRVVGGAKGKSAISNSLASAVASEIESASEFMRPPLLDSLPGDGISRRTYFLGPNALSGFVSEGKEMFDFAGQAVGALAEYGPGGVSGQQRDGEESDSSRLPRKTAKLLIVECQTPQLATAAMIRARSYLDGLPEGIRDNGILKREGNYIIWAIGFADRTAAQELVDSVKYPYTVKWLRNPLLPTTDPWHAQKAAQVLISTFALLGLMVLAVLVVGSAVGAVVFLRRRRMQREVFSDAGGMVRLELDPFDAVILGLPPARSGDE